MSPNKNDYYNPKNVKAYSLLTLNNVVLNIDYKL